MELSLSKMAVVYWDFDGHFGRTGEATLNDLYATVITFLYPNETNLTIKIYISF